jgi:hypothetical protein
MAARLVFMASPRLKTRQFQQRYSLQARTMRWLAGLRGRYPYVGHQTDRLYLCKNYQ